MENKNNTVPTTFKSILALKGFRFIINEDTTGTGAGTLPEGEDKTTEVTEDKTPITSPAQDANDTTKEIPSTSKPEAKKDDDDSDLEDDEEELPEADEDSEIDWDKSAPLPKSIHQAKSLRKENISIKQKYKALNAKYEKLLADEEVRVQAEAEKAVVGKKNEIIQKYNLSAEDSALFTGTDETVWESLAKRLTPKAERISSNTPNSGVKKVLPATSGSDLYSKYMKNR